MTIIVKLLNLFHVIVMNNNMLTRLKWHDLMQLFLNACNTYSLRRKCADGRERLDNHLHVMHLYKTMSKENWCP